MKFLLGSDLHIEFYRSFEAANRAFGELPDPSEYDVVLLSGDIGLGVQGVEWIKQYFPENKPIAYLPGNHEYYRQAGGIAGTDARLLAACEEANIAFLNPGVSDIYGEVVVIGAALWTDFKLRGYNDPLMTDLAYRQNITDFKVIEDANGLFHPKEARVLYQAHYAFLKRQLASYGGSDKKIVVMTHWVPSQICIDPKYTNDRFNPYFTNDCDDLMREGMLWVYGHTHSRLDIEHPSGARLVGNPAGYPGENPGFRWKILEV